MRRMLLLALISVILAITVAISGWLLFGWQSEKNIDQGTITNLRRWGRYTVMRHYKNGKLDSETKWPWSRSYHGIVDGPCGNPDWILMREDRNLDGRWDTWIVRPDPSKPCSILIRADTNMDGKPDWEEAAALDDPGPFTRLKAIRGF